MKKGVVVEKSKRRAFTAEFKIDAVKLIAEGGLGYAEVGRRLDVLPKLVKNWGQQYRHGALIAVAPRLRVTAELEGTHLMRALEWPTPAATVGDTADLVGTGPE